MILLDLGRFERRLELPFGAIVPWIAEFYNTVSNAPFVLLSLLRLLEGDNSPDIHHAYILLALVGIGSGIHHATTPKWTIVIDWIPILLLLHFACSVWPLSHIP